MSKININGTNVNPSGPVQPIDSGFLETTAAPSISTAVVGPQGPPGPIGPTGPTGPPGGATFEQVISTPTASFNVVHNLGRIPSVVWVDSEGDYELADVTYVDVNTVALLFPAPVTGTVVCS